MTALDPGLSSTAGLADSAASPVRRVTRDDDAAHGGLWAEHDDDDGSGGDGGRWADDGDADGRAVVTPAPAVLRSPATVAADAPPPLDGGSWA